MNTFEEILTSMLKAVEENPSANVDDVITAKVAELGLSPEGMKTLEETNSYLEAYDEMYQKLQTAKAEGDSRSKWVQDELISIGDKYNLTDEQKEALIESVFEACEKELKQTLSEGE